MLDVCWIDPEVAITVTVACTGGFAPPPPPAPPPPQPEMKPRPTTPAAIKTTQIRSRRHLERIRQRTSASAVNGKYDPGPRRNAAEVLAESVNCVVAETPPEGVTMDGLNRQVTPDGSPQENVTAELNAFCGVTVRVTVPEPPAPILTVPGEAAKVNDAGGGRLMMYTEDAT